MGRAIAHGSAKRGASLGGLIERNPEALNAAKEERAALGGKALVLPLDVSNCEAVDAAASRVEEEPVRIEVKNLLSVKLIMDADAGAFNGWSSASASSILSSGR